MRFQELFSKNDFFDRFTATRDRSFLFQIGVVLVFTLMVFTALITAVLHL